MTANARASAKLTPGKCARDTRNRLHGVALGRGLVLDSTEMVGLVREDLQRLGGRLRSLVTAPSGQTGFCARGRLHEVHQVRTDIRTQTRPVRRLRSVELNDAARLHDLPVGEVFATNLHRSTGNQRRDLPQTPLEHVGRTMRHFDVAPPLGVVVLQRSCIRTGHHEVKADEQRSSQCPARDELPLTRPHSPATIGRLAGLLKLLAMSFPTRSGLMCELPRDRKDARPCPK